MAGAQGWQGVQTLPRVVTVDYDTPAMIMTPPVEIESLRLAQLYDTQDAALDGPNSARARPYAASCTYSLKTICRLRAWHQRQPGCGRGSCAAPQRSPCPPAVDLQQSSLHLRHCCASKPPP